MRKSSARLITATLVFVLGAGSTVMASRPAKVIETTVTPPPAIETSPTPTPARPRSLGQSQNPTPTVIEQGRIYEGNYFGEPVTFLLNAELGQLFILEVTTPDFDAVLEVFDASGNQVASDDDSGPGNMPQLFFVAPATGQFKVNLRGYSDPVEGSYILRANSVMDTLEFGVPVAVTMDGVLSHTYSFEAVRGDVINLTALSDDTVDTTLRLIGPDGVEVGYIDDFSGVDPEFRRLPLVADGRYIVLHAPYSESAVGDVTLLLEKTEIGTISADPLKLELTSAELTDIFSFEVEQGNLYIVTISTSGLVSGSLSVGSIDTSSESSSTFTNSEGASLIYRATFTGSARVRVTVQSSQSDPAPIDVFVSLRAVNQ